LLTILIFVSFRFLPFLFNRLFVVVIEEFTLLLLRAFLTFVVVVIIEVVAA